jgi:hypothetical protein
LESLSSELNGDKTQIAVSWIGYLLIIKKFTSRNLLVNFSQEEIFSCRSS